MMMTMMGMTANEMTMGMKEIQILTMIMIIGMTGNVDFKIRYVSSKWFLGCTQRGEISSTSKRFCELKYGAKELLSSHFLALIKVAGPIEELELP